MEVIWQNNKRFSTVWVFSKRYSMYLTLRYLERKNIVKIKKNLTLDKCLKISLNQPIKYLIKK